MASLTRPEARPWAGAAYAGGTTDFAPADGARSQSQRALDQYRDLLAVELGVSPAEAESRCRDLAAAVVSLDREAFRDAAQVVTDRLIARPEDAPTRERLSTLRDEAWRRSLEPAEPTPEHHASPSAATERYLNAEFVAIYW